MRGEAKTIVRPSGVRYRICRTCGAEKRLSTQFFSPARRKWGEVIAWTYNCKSCAVEVQRIRLARIKSTEPARWQEMNRKRNGFQRSWRGRNPDKAHAAAKRFSDSRKGDPERRQERRESLRMGYRLRRMRQGKSVQPVRWKQTRNEPRLPWQPLEQYMQESGVRLSGWDRILHRARKQGTITLDNADLICVALNTHLAIIYPDFYS